MNAHDASGPAFLDIGGLTIKPGERPYLMGVLNVTPDSFSDGGRYLERQAALERAAQLVEEGADLIDVGGESSRPGSEPVPAQVEMERVLPVIEEICRRHRVPVSVDTTKAEVAERAIAAGASMVNDISALRFDPRLGEVVARSGVALCLMHMRGVPKTMQAGEIVYQDLLGEVATFLCQAMERAEQAGVGRERILLDPGIGFGKTAAHNLILLHRLEELRRLGRPLLVGVSRKAFIGKVLDLPVERRLFGTAAAVAAAVLGGADVLRVHDVGPMREVALVAHAIRRERLAEARE